MKKKSVLFLMKKSPVTPTRGRCQVQAFFFHTHLSDLAFKKKKNIFLKSAERVSESESREQPSNLSFVFFVFLFFFFFFSNFRSCVLRKRGFLRFEKEKRKKKKKIKGDEEEEEKKKKMS